MTNQELSNLENEIFLTVEITSWDELKAGFKNYGDWWLFRGQADFNWVLQTTIERSEIVQKYLVEHDIINDFRKYMRQYDIKTLPGNSIDTIHFLQHYGAPTRLLDFTYSPYVGCYFAIKDDSTSDFCSLYGMESNNYFLSPGEIEMHLADEHKQVSCIFRSEPSFPDLRMRAQNGCSLGTGNPDLSFLENLRIHFEEEPAPEKPIKWKIPSTLKGEILYDLKKMNITEATLFPGLDGFVRSLKYYRFHA